MKIKRDFSAVLRSHLKEVKLKQTLSGFKTLKGLKNRRISKSQKTALIRPHSFTTSQVSETVRFESNSNLSVFTTVPGGITKTKFQILQPYTYLYVVPNGTMGRGAFFYPYIVPNGTGKPFRVLSADWQYLPGCKTKTKIRITINPISGLTP